MIFSAPFLIHTLRWIPPAASLLGSTATYMTAWALLQCASLVLPARAASRLERTLYSSYQAMVGFWFETWSGVEFCFYGDRLPDTPENVLYLSNHQCTVDWVVVEVLCLKQGWCGGRTRYILKDTIRFLPLYGLVLGERGGIFVKRRSRDQERYIRGLRRLADTNTPTWLVIFPEGTRFNPTKQSRIEKSQEYARSLGIPEMKHVLTPKTTGFELALGNIRNHFSAVYDVTIYYEGYHHGNQSRAPPPNMFGFFSGQCLRVHVHIHRVPMAELPTSPEEQRAWLYDAYCHKERLIEEFLTTGTTTSPQVPYPLPLSHTLLPTLLYSAVVVEVFSHRHGQLWWAGSLLAFSALGTIRMALKSS